MSVKKIIFVRPVVTVSVIKDGKELVYTRPLNGENRRKVLRQLHKDIKEGRV